MTGSDAADPTLSADQLLQVVEIRLVGARALGERAQLDDQVVHRVTDARLVALHVEVRPEAVDGELEDLPRDAERDGKTHAEERDEPARPGQPTDRDPPEDQRDGDRDLVAGGRSRTGDWAREQIGPDGVAFLRDLPFSIRVPRPGAEANRETDLIVDVRGRPEAVDVVRLPFYRRST